MKREDLGALDRFRLLSALLVVAIHTGPLSSLSETGDYLLCRGLARLAVPFFFTVTGFFLLPRAAQQGLSALKQFWKKGLLLYGGAIVLYLPVMVYTGYFRQDELPIHLARDLVFNGTFYHLWYLPAVLLGAAVAFPLARHTRLALPVCTALYLFGLLGDSYYGLGLFPEELFLLFDYSRNGLFFAPLFLLLGGALAARPPRHTRRWYGCAFALCLLLLCGEALLVRRLELARHDSMYLLLPLCLWTLVRLLCAFPSAPRPGLREASTVVYLIHPLCIIGVRGVSKALGIFELVVGNSLIFYLCVCLASLAAAWVWAAVRPVPCVPTARAWVEVDLDAVRRNARHLQSLLPRGCSLMAVVKADAYGHGAVPVARALRRDGVDCFAVATAAEGAALRRHGVRGTILVLGYTPPEQFPLLSRCRLTQAVTDFEHAAALSRFGRRLRVHLAVDTGMHRLGFPWNEPDELARAMALPHLRVTGLFSHLCICDKDGEQARAFTREQIGRFLSVTGRFPHLPAHLQSSAGILSYPLPPCCAWARPGLALYGALDAPGLTPALSLKARVVQVRHLCAGEGAGYDLAFTAARDTVLAVVSIGYADGVPRALSRGKGSLILHGRRVPVAGLICMDQLLADVTELGSAVQVGDVALLIGPGLPPWQVAEDAGSIPNELLSRLGPRLPRVYRQGGTVSSP